MKCFENYNIKNELSFYNDVICKKYYEIITTNELREILKEITEKQEKFVVLGNGSNILFKKNMYDGNVISLKRLLGIRKKGRKIECFAGEKLQNLIDYSLNYNLSGLELLSGIPASVGGAIRMNAGAYGSEICKFLHSVFVLDIEKNKVKKLAKKQLMFSYRNSQIKNKKFIVLKAVFRLKKISKKEKQDCIFKKDEIIQNRLLRYPKEPSCGSVFKRKENLIVSKTLDELGLKGIFVGGAKLSEKHAGFIINTGNATGEDYLSLANQIKTIVLEKTKEELEMEVEVVE